MAGSLNSGGGGHDGGFNLYEALLKYEESVKQTKIQIAQKEDAVANLNAQIAKLKVDNGRKKQYIERNKLQIQVVDAKMEAEIQRKKKFQSKAAEKEEELARVQADAEKGRAMLERVKEFDKQRKIKLAEIQKTFMEGYMQIPECARYIQQGEKLKEVEARNEKREKQIAENQAFLDEYRLTSHQEWEDFREDVVAVIQLKKDEEKRQKELAEVLANTKRLLEKKDVLEKKFQSGGSSSFEPSTPFPRRVPPIPILEPKDQDLDDTTINNQTNYSPIIPQVFPTTPINPRRPHSSTPSHKLSYVASPETSPIPVPDKENDPVFTKVFTPCRPIETVRRVETPGNYYVECSDDEDEESMDQSSSRFIRNEDLFTYDEEELQRRLLDRTAESTKEDPLPRSVRMKLGKIEKQRLKKTIWGNDTMIIEEEQEKEDEVVSSPIEVMEQEKDFERSLSPALVHNEQSHTPTPPHHQPKKPWLDSDIQLQSDLDRTRPPAPWQFDKEEIHSSRRPEKGTRRIQKSPTAEGTFRSNREGSESRSFSSRVRCRD